MGDGWFSEGGDVLRWVDSGAVVVNWLEELGAALPTDG